MYTIYGTRDRKRLVMVKVTIKDVAREAGVSISTVSNALNGVDVLRPETKAHILETAKKLQYIPDLNGRNLKASATKVIGLFVPSMGGPYYGTLSDSIFWECQKYGYELNIFISHSKTSMMTNLLGKRVDGAIILNNFLEESEEERIKEMQIPTIFLDREIANDSMGSVVFDSYQAGVLAAEYFLKKGLTKLGYIMGAMDNYDEQKRYAGFKERIEKEGLILEDAYVFQGNFERERTCMAMKQFLAEKKTLPEGIFAANDLSAIGCMEAFKDYGIQVPEKVKLLGCDDIELAAWYRPSLTTIHTGFEIQGTLAVTELMKLIQKKEKGKISWLKAKIIPRESV